jgi:hypothetical protein
MARSVIAGVLGMVAVLGAMPGVRAQIAPLDDVTDPIEDTVDQLEDTVEQAGGTVGQTVEEAGAAVGEGNSAPGTPSEAVGASPVDETGEHGSGPVETERSSARRLGADGATGRMAHLLSETGSPLLEPAVYVPLVVRLTNDADRDGSYAEAESAARPRADVPFQLGLENAGPYELVVLAIRDASPTPLGLSDEALCSGMAGTRLAPNQSTVCRFTVEGLAPAEGERVVAVLEVDAAETADPSTTGTVTDTSVIRTGNVGVLGAVVRRTLATTGARIAILVAVAVGLAVAGVWMIRLGDRRRAASRTWIRPRTAAGATAPRPRTEGHPALPRRRGRSRHTIGPSVAGHPTVQREGLTAGTSRR